MKCRSPACNTGMFVVLALASLAPLSSPLLLAPLALLLLAPLAPLPVSPPASLCDGKCPDSSGDLGKECPTLFDLLAFGVDTVLVVPIAFLVA